jgi:hypothetical protein
MLKKYITNTYLAFNFIVGSIYVLWIYLLYYYNCKCSKHILEKLIHIYWYIIFILDILLFFKFFSISELHLVVIGNLLGLGNIYMTYQYMKILDDKNCECSNMLLKDLIIIIYIIVTVMIMSFFIALIISYLHYGKIYLFDNIHHKIVN